jgi:hypothetical protein
MQRGLADLRAMRQAVLTAVRQAEQRAEASCRQQTQVAAASGNRGGQPAQGGDNEPDPGFAWDTRIRVHGIECFGGAHLPTTFDHYHLNGRFVGVDRRAYDRVRSAALKTGAPFCGSWEVSRETTTKGGAATADERPFPGFKQ